jgi:hypothetical protein
MAHIMFPTSPPVVMRKTGGDTSHSGRDGVRQHVLKFFERKRSNSSVGAGKSASLNSNLGNVGATIPSKNGKNVNQSGGNGNQSNNLSSSGVPGSISVGGPAKTTSATGAAKTTSSGVSKPGVVDNNAALGAKSASGSIPKRPPAAPAIMGEVKAAKLKSQTQPLAQGNNGAQKTSEGGGGSASSNLNQTAAPKQKSGSTVRSTHQQSGSATGNGGNAAAQAELQQIHINSSLQVRWPWMQSLFMGLFCNCFRALRCAFPSNGKEDATNELAQLLVRCFAAYQQAALQSKMLPVIMEIGRMDPVLLVSIMGKCARRIDIQGGAVSANVTGAASSASGGAASLSSASAANSASAASANSAESGNSFPQKASSAKSASTSTGMVQDSQASRGAQAITRSTVTAGARSQTAAEATTQPDTPAPTAAAQQLQQITNQLQQTASQQTQQPHTAASYSSNALFVLCSFLASEPMLCYQILPMLVEQVLNNCLDPSEPTLRKTMLLPATQTLHSIVQLLPMASFHQGSQV